MDIKRAVKQKPMWQRYWYIFALPVAIIVTLLLRNTLGDASYFVNKDNLVTATVEQGNFTVNVRASGILKSLNIRWVSAQVSGRAEQVFVKPGAKVEAGDILVQLSNPELHRNLDKARWELEVLKAESHATLVNIESQLVDLENLVLSADYSYQSAKLKLDAETELMTRGNGTVSALEFKRSQLDVKQQQQFWQAQQQKVAKMKLNMEATKTAQAARIGLLENTYQRAQQQVAALQITATTAGVIQQVSLELGQRAQVGDNVTLVADQTTLFAELQVQEARIKDIALGQSVSIDTRNSQIEGKIVRIDPAVNGGMVSVDVLLVGELPSEARPELTVDGLITISNVQNTLYVKRPVFAPRFSDIGLYRLSEDKLFAQKQLVSLGQSSVSKIQIIDGLTEGDEIIISDTSKWQKHNDIRIN